MARNGRGNQRRNSPVHEHLTRKQRMQQREQRRRQSDPTNEEYEEVVRQRQRNRQNTTSGTENPDTANATTEANSQEDFLPTIHHADSGEYLLNLDNVSHMIQNALGRISEEIHRLIAEQNERIDSLFEVSNPASLTAARSANSRNPPEVQLPPSDVPANHEDRPEASLINHRHATTNSSTSLSRISSVDLKPAEFSAKGHYDVDKWVEQFEYVTCSYDENHRKVLFVSLLRDHALDWFIDNRRELDSRPLSIWLTRFKERFAKSAGDKLHELQAIRWQSGDNPRDFIKNITDKAARIGDGVVQPYALNKYLLTMLKTHPQYEAIIKPNFPETTEGVLIRLYQASEAEQTKAHEPKAKTSFLQVEMNNENLEEEKDVNLAFKQPPRRPSKPKNVPLPRQNINNGQPAKFQGNCFFCNKPGHRERECYSRLRGFQAQNIQPLYQQQPQLQHSPCPNWRNNPYNRWNFQPQFPQPFGQVHPRMNYSPLKTKFSNKNSTTTTSFELKIVKPRNPSLDPKIYLEKLKNDDPLTLYVGSLHYSASRDREGFPIPD